MDGELSRETGLFMARRLSSDPELSAVWRRYHLIRDSMRQPGSGAAVVDLSARVRPQLDGEAMQAATAPITKRWLRPAAGLAVAASVALMAVALVGPDLGVGRAGPVADIAQDSGSFSSPNTLPAVPVSQPASFSPGNRDTERRLNSYLLRHNQLAGAAGRQGFVSFVPIISTQKPEVEETGAEQVADQPEAAAEAVPVATTQP